MAAKNGGFKEKSPFTDFEGCERRLFLRADGKVESAAQALRTLIERSAIQVVHEKRLSRSRH
jgi:hypothetical protein